MSAEQGTAEWLQERCGCVTASRFAEVLKPPRTKSATWSQAAESYALQLAGERLTGRVASQGGSAATEWGTAEEPAAREQYTQATGRRVETVGFEVHPFADRIGASVDGLVGDDGTIEIKSPYTVAKHVATWIADAMPEEHMPQVQGGLYVTGRDWCDFVSWHPYMPEESRLFICRVERDDGYIARMAERLEAFDAYVHTIVERVLNG